MCINTNKITINYRTQQNMQGSYIIHTQGLAVVLISAIEHRATQASVMSRITG